MVNLQKKYYTSGEWKNASKDKELRSPFSDEVIAIIPQLTVCEVQIVIDKAYEARETMRKLTAAERSQVLEELTSLLIKNREKAARIISLESAKPLKLALQEIDRTIETYKFAAEETKRLTGEMIPMDAAKNGKGRFGYTIQEPIGVIGAITPFNFPQNLVAHKVGPAIASGNPIVLKPASQTPLSALFLAELIDQTSLPKGGFHVITGSGAVIGDVLVESDKIAMITFTGSPSVGIGIQKKAGLKRTALELGSNSGLLVDSDVNLDTVAKRCVNGAFSNQGQVCISLQRTYVMSDVYEKFLEKFVEESKKLKVGSPLDLETDITVMITQNEQVRAEEWVKEAVDLGAVVELGGAIENNVFMPTILSNVKAEARICCEEAFAPIVLVNRIESIEEGIQHINNSNYGLQAGIFTNDIQTAFQTAEKLEVGGVIINDIPTYRVDQMPYGGVKESGNSKEGIKYAIQDMTEMKLVVWNNS